MHHIFILGWVPGSQSRQWQWTKEGLLSSQPQGYWAVCAPCPQTVSSEVWGLLHPEVGKNSQTSDDTWGDPLNLKVWQLRSPLRPLCVHVCVCGGGAYARIPFTKIIWQFRWKDKVHATGHTGHESTGGDCGCGCVCFPHPLPLMLVPNCKASSVHDKLLFIDKASIFPIR